MYAVQASPSKGTSLPGVLHVHGGGQTASIDWVRFWAKRGYVGVTFDFCGRWEKRTEFTDWGPLKQGNMTEARGGFQLRPTPRESSWYLAGRSPCSPNIPKSIRSGWASSASVSAERLRG